MRKTMTAIVASVLLVAACGESGPPKPEGRYQSKLGPGQTFTLNFLDGSTVEASFDEGAGGGAPESYKTSYTMASVGTITMKIPDQERQADSDAPEALTLKRNGEALEMNMQGMTIRFDKS
jgi:hypothetical protein